MLSHLMLYHRFSQGTVNRRFKLPVNFIQTYQLLRKMYQHRQLAELTVHFLLVLSLFLT